MIDLISLFGRAGMKISDLSRQRAAFLSTCKTRKCGHLTGLQQKCCCAIHKDYGIYLGDRFHC